MSTAVLYDYSTRRELRHGAGSLEKRTRWFGRCTCGRETRMHYSTPEAALSAIRLVHNANVQCEREYHDEHSS